MKTLKKIRVLCRKISIRIYNIRMACIGQISATKYPHKWDDSLSWDENVKRIGQS